MTVKLLTEQHLELLSLKGGCVGSSESIHVKMPHCWKSHVAAQSLSYLLLCRIFLCVALLPDFYPISLQSSRCPDPDQVALPEAN